MKYPATVQDMNNTTDETTNARKLEQTSNRRTNSWRDYIGVTKVGLTVANLFTTFVGFWVASHGSIQPIRLLVTMLGTALVIAGGCTLNNYIDRDIDHRMTRTQHRALVQGRLQPDAVLRMGIILSVLGLIILGAFATLMAAVFAWIGLITYVGVYTLWLKRTSPLSTAIGGISGAVPPLIGWTAVTGHLNMTAWALFAFMFLWQPPHFFALAMKRCEEYRAAGIPLLPVVKGFAKTKRHILAWTIVMIPATYLFVLFKTVGSMYMITATVLGIVYLVYAILGFWSKDDIRWSKHMFNYSLVYMNVLFLVMLADLV
jgi:protoheme IX farnesyltransferase